VKSIAEAAEARQVGDLSDLKIADRDSQKPDIYFHLMTQPSAP
jgi:hypothetical protein